MPPRRLLTLVVALAWFAADAQALEQTDLRFELRGGPGNALAWVDGFEAPLVTVRCAGDAGTTSCRPFPLEADFVEQYSDPRMADWTRRLKDEQPCAACAGIADRAFVETLDDKGVGAETIVGYRHKRRRAAILLAYVTSAGDALRQLAQNAVEPKRQTALANARMGLVLAQKKVEADCTAFNRSGLTAAERELVIKRSLADLRAQEQFWAELFPGAVMTCRAPLAELKFPPAVVKAEAQPVVAASIIAMPAAVVAARPAVAPPAAAKPDARTESRPAAAARAPAPPAQVPAHIAMKAEADRLAKQAAAARQRGLYERGGIGDWADEASGNIGALYNSAGAVVANPETYSKAGSALLDGKTYADAGAAVINPDNWGAALEGGLEMVVVTPFAMLFDNCLFNHAGGRTNPGWDYWLASCMSSGGLYAASIAIPVGKGGGMIPKYNAAGMTEAERTVALSVAKATLALETKVVNVLIESQRAVGARVIEGGVPPTYFTNAANGELTALVKMSEVGYPIENAAVVSNKMKNLAGGKAAGEDAYLAIDYLKQEYRLVKMAPDGSPVGYKAARIVESTTGAPYSEIAATALKQIRAENAAGAGEAAVHLAPAPAGATKAAAALAQRLEPLTSKGVAPIFKKQGDMFIEVHLSASKDRALSRFTEKEIAELLSWGNKTEVFEDLPGLRFYMVDDQGRAIYRDIVTNQYAAVPVAAARSGAPGAVALEELGGRYFSVKPEIDRVVVTASKPSAPKPAAPAVKSPAVRPALTEEASGAPSVLSQWRQHGSSGWADPPDPRQVDWSARPGHVFDDLGRPVNPNAGQGYLNGGRDVSREAGRGLLGRWGECPTSTTILRSRTVDGAEHVALIQRPDGSWAFMGGFLNLSGGRWETALAAAVRETVEEVGVHLDPALLRPVYGRAVHVVDPRNGPHAWIADNVYVARVDGLPALSAADDARSAVWVPVTDPRLSRLYGGHTDHFRRAMAVPEPAAATPAVAPAMPRPGVYDLVREEALAQKGYVIDSALKSLSHPQEIRAFLAEYIPAMVKNAAGGAGVERAVLDGLKGMVSRGEVAAGSEKAWLDAITELSAKAAPPAVKRPVPAAIAAPAAKKASQGFRIPGAGLTGREAEVARKLQDIIKKGGAPVFRKRDPSTILNTSELWEEAHSLAMFSAEDMALMRAWGNEPLVIGEWSGVKFSGLDDRGRAVFRKWGKTDEVFTVPATRAGVESLIARLQDAQRKRFFAVKNPYSELLDLTALPRGLPARYEKALQGVIALWKSRKASFARLQEFEAEVALRVATKGELPEEAMQAVLSAYEARHGFSSPVNLLRELSPDEFHWVLSVGSPLNDFEFAGASHGMLSHRVQWHLIMRQLEAEPTTFGGLTRVSDLYRALGDGPLARSLDWTAASARERDLWASLFDGTPRLQNFSSPDYLHLTREFVPLTGRWRLP